MSDLLNFIFIKGHQTLSSEMAFVLFELDHSFFPTPWSLDSWQKMFLDHERLLVVALINEQVIGFCLFEKSTGDSFAHLLKILIHPQFQNQGISKKLLVISLNDLELDGCHQFFLEVEETNLAAQKLYSRLGFQKIHRKKDFYGENRAAVIMTKGQ